MKDKKQKVILSLIIIFVLVIIMLILVLLSLNNTSNYSNINDNNGGAISSNQTHIYDYNIYDIPYDGPKEETNKETKNKITYVKNRVNYFTISSLYNNYIEVIGSKNKENLKNILSNEYIANYNITDDNIFKKLNVPTLTNSSQYYKATIIEMLETKVDDSTNIYIVKGKCRVVNMDNTIFDINAMFQIDTINNTYSVYPYDYIKNNNYDLLKEGDSIKYIPEKIAKNYNNQFKSITKTDAEIAKIYVDNYRELLLYYKDEAYNKLNSEYAQKRFKSKENFDTYLNDNKIGIAFMNCEKFKVNSYQNYTDYICSDKYNNIYIFRQQGGIMRYSVFLDNYTIMLDEYSKEYNKLDKFDKGKYNLTKFINMVNTKDYNAIYNVLDTTFRTNNFKTLDSLKQFIQNNMYDLNSIEIKDADNKTYEYYIFNCKITNMRNNNESKNMTIIINQTEGTEFTMSFSFN